MSKLTEKQIMFCKEYIIDFNATRAAKSAGYSEKTASEMGYENLTKPQIQEYIKKLTAKREEKLELSAEMVVKELMKIAFADVKELYDENGRLLEPYELSDSAAATISSFKSRREGDKKDGLYQVEEYKRFSKEKSLELLGKHLGLFELDNKQKISDINPNWTVNVVKPGDK